MSADTAGFVIKQGDTRPLEFTLTVDGTPQDLTGASVVLTLQWWGTSNYLLNKKSCTVVNGPEGLCSYAWSAGETSTTGSLVGEVEVTFADGTVLTFPNNGTFRALITKRIS